MLEDVGGITSQLVGVALDAALLRHEVIANNIANSDSVGYQVKRLNFDKQLAQMSVMLNEKQQLSESNETMVRERINELKTILHNSDNLIEEGGDSVELDREMVRLTENTLRYQALLTAAGKRGDIIALAVQEGRRG
jgi:flagellar basal-body rod protein FlgB